MNEEQRSLLLNYFTSHSASFSEGMKMCYGAGGFTGDASLLESTAYRAGILAALRSLKSQSVIGLIITACGDVADSNGVRIIDPDGGMLTSQWEPFADSIANAGDPVECVSLIEKFVIEENISFGGGQPAEIWLGRNMRPGGESLLRAAKQGISSIVGAVSCDMGILTAPQLHWLVRAKNKGFKANEHNYFEQLSGSYRCLLDLIPNKTTSDSIGEKLVVDGAYDVGGFKLEMFKDLCDGPAMEIRNSVKDGGTSEGVGIDFFRKAKIMPSGFCPSNVELRCASLDADAERFVYFLVKPSCNEIDFIDGDKIVSLFALFIRDQLSDLEVESEKANHHYHASLGIIQSAGADGASAAYLKGLGFNVVFLPGGVKCLHEEAAKYDIGIYFNGDGRGTILFSESYLCWLESMDNELSSSPEGSRKQQAAHRLLAVSRLMNQTTTDALGGLLLVEAILRHMHWSVQQWNGLYDLPKRELNAVAVEGMDASGKGQSIVNGLSAIQEGTNSEIGRENGIYVSLTQHPEHVVLEPVGCDSQRVDDSKVDTKGPNDLDTEQSLESQVGGTILILPNKIEKQSSPESSAKIEDKGESETTNMLSDKTAEKNMPESTAEVEESEGNCVKVHSDETETQKVSCGEEVVKERKFQLDTEQPTGQEAEMRDLNNTCPAQVLEEKKPDSVADKGAALSHNEIKSRGAPDNVLQLLGTEVVDRPAVDGKGDRLVASNVGADMKDKEVIARSVEPSCGEHTCLSSEVIDDTVLVGSVKDLSTSGGADRTEETSVIDGDGSLADSEPQSLDKGGPILNPSHGNNVKLETDVDCVKDLAGTTYIDQTEETGDVSTAGSTCDRKPQSLAIADDFMSSSPVIDVKIKTNAVTSKDLSIPADNDKSKEAGVMNAAGSTCGTKPQPVENGNFIVNSSHSGDVKYETEAANGDVDVKNRSSCLVDGKSSDMNISFSSSGVSATKDLVGSTKNFPASSGLDETHQTGAVNVDVNLQPQVNGMSSLCSSFDHKDMVTNEAENSQDDTGIGSNAIADSVGMETKISPSTSEVNKVNVHFSNGQDMCIPSEVDKLEGVYNGAVDTCSQPEMDGVLPSHVRAANCEIESENGPVHIENKSTSIVNNVEGKADFSVEETGETKPPSVMINMSSGISSSLHDTKSESEAENGPFDADESGSSHSADDRYPQSQLNSVDAHVCPTHDAKVESAAEGVSVHGDCRPVGRGSTFGLSTISFGSFKSEYFAGSLGSQVINGSSRGSGCQGDAGDNLSESKAEEAPSVGTRNFPQRNAASFDCVERGHGNNDGQANDELVSIKGPNADEVSTSCEGSATDALDGESVGTEVVKMPFYYLIKIPRHDDPKLSDKKKLAEAEVEEKTCRRDAVQAEYKKEKEICLELKQKLDTAIQEERDARDRVRARRKEMDSAQALVNIAKDAMTIEDLDRKIMDMEHKIQHETMSLSEEKNLIREIKMSKQLREQLLAASKKQGVEHALDGKEKNKEHLKVLRKEMDALRQRLSRLEQATKAAQRKYVEETSKLNELYGKCQSANAVRDQAFVNLLHLRKQWSEKVKHFYRWKEDQAIAYRYAAAGDKESLQHHCLNQVETIMRLWNMNDEFRREYIRCNRWRTVRNFGTFDGRALGTNEEPASLGVVSGHRVSISVKEAQVPKEATVEPPLASEAKNSDDQSLKKVVEQKIPKLITKKSSKATPVKHDSAEASSMVEMEEDKDVLKLKQEEVLARKAEELRKEKEAAKLKELHRQEEKAKAQKALERKRRNAEKVQARAEIKAKKEAEQREKEREKRARKKERKKAANAEISISNPETEAATSTEVSNEPNKEPEVREQRSVTTTKRSRRTQYSKQNKIKSIAPPPLPLRNRGKRRMQQWMWVLVTVVAVLGLFFLGNRNFSLIREFFGSI